jgi:hypothetical protein
MWESRSVCSEGFSKQFVEIINRMPPKASLLDFHSCGIFHSPFRPPIFSVRGWGACYSQWEKFVESSKPISNVN